MRDGGTREVGTWCVCLPYGHPPPLLRAHQCPSSWASTDTTCSSLHCTGKGGTGQHGRLGSGARAVAAAAAEASTPAGGRPDLHQKRVVEDDPLI